MTIREALGGPWSAHWLVIVAFLPPSTLLVLLRESVTPFPEWWWPLVSAGAQHVVTGIVILLGASIARSVHAIMPVPTVLAIWSLGAALRGVVAGTLAEEVAGVDGQILARSAIWALVSLVWVPPMVYAIAQFERRRLILGAIDITEYELERERPRADASSAAVQRQLRIAVAESLAPALHDLQASLDASRASLDRGAVAELSLHVSRLHDDAADLLDSAREAPATPPRAVASLRRALDVPPRRPWLIAFLVGLGTSALVVFDSWVIYGELAAREVAVSTAAAAIVIGAVPAAIARYRPDVLRANGQRTTGVVALLGIFTATLLMLNSGIDPITWHGLVIVPLLALGLTIAIATASGALLLADANLDAERRLAELQSELVSLHDRNDALMRRERERLGDLMHGPVQGRIAACIMALNFHTTGGGGPEAGRELVDAVLDHLQSVSRDLAKITGRASTIAP